MSSPMRVGGEVMRRRRRDPFINIPHGYTMRTCCACLHARNAPEERSPSLGALATRQVQHAHMLCIFAGHALEARWKLGSTLCVR